MAKSAFLVHNRIKLFSPYDITLINKIKAIRGRKWVALDRCWSVPINAVSQVRELGFDTNKIEKHLQNEKLAKINKYKNVDIMKKYPFLYPHQHTCVQRGLMDGSLLISDDCGIGKSCEALAIAQIHDRPIVVICPSSIKHQWKNEAKKWFNMNLKVIEGTPIQRIYTDLTGIILNYELLLRDYKKIERYCKDATIIFDEASYLKNPKSKRTIFANRLKAKYILALTGTPIETKLADGFNIGQLVDKNWMDKNEFFSDYCVLDDVYGGIEGYRNVSKFMQRLKEISIRRMKSDIKDMPNKVVMKRIIAISPQQKKMTEFVKKYFTDCMKKTDSFPIEEFVIMPLIENGVELVMESDSKIARLMKKCFTLTPDSPKLNELIRATDEMSDKKVVIFTKFKKMQPFIVKALDNDNCIVGNSDTKDKLSLIEQFKDGTKRYLIVTDAFAYGVDIPFATALINFDIPWNHAKLKQRSNRIYRISSKHPIVIINMVSDGFEQYIYDKMSVGKGMADKFTSVVRGFME